MSRACSLLLATALAACGRPNPIVVCHNANCASGDTQRDDTLPALAESLALQVDGLPVVDGVELDTFWYGAEGRCLFAHDLEHDTTTPASAAAQMVGDALAGTTMASRNGEPFYVFIELKAEVGHSYGDAHTEEQRIAHAECALDVADIIAAGARVGGQAFTVGFISSAPELLAALVERPRWQDPSDPSVERLLVGDIFVPYSSVAPALSDYHVPLDVIEYHPAFMTEGRRQAYRAQGLDLAQWSYATTDEALAALTRYEPRFVITSEATFLRRWIER